MIRSSFIMVHQTRLELVRVAPHAPQTCAYTYSATGASLTIIEYIFDFLYNIVGIGENNEFI